MRQMHKVGRVSQVKDGQALEAVIDGERLAVFAVEGKWVATTGTCPHAGGPLSEGTVCDAMLSCPWHGWSFNLQTGECEEDPDLVLPLYEVHVEGDDIFVIL
jgi:nitrite reductase (NADH) small subunit